MSNKKPELKRNRENNQGWETLIFSQVGFFYFEDIFFDKIALRQD